MLLYHGATWLDDAHPALTASCAISARPLSNASGASRGLTVFFDPDALGDVPQPISSEAMRNDVLKAMSAAGIAPAIGYAHAKTGYLVVKGFEDRFTPEALAEWQAAIEEYRRLEAKGLST